MVQSVELRQWARVGGFLSLHNSRARNLLSVKHMHTDLTLSSFDLVLFFARLSPEVPTVPEIRHGESV